MEGSQWETHSLMVSLPLGGISFVAVEGLRPSREHTNDNKNTVIIHTNWQLNEVQLQVCQGSTGRRSEASGDKSNFSRIMNLTSQTLLVDYFCSFIQISPPMSVHNLSHLKCPVVGEGM